MICWAMTNKYYTWCVDNKQQVHTTCRCPYKICCAMSTSLYKFWMATQDLLTTNNKFIQPLDVRTRSVVQWQLVCTNFGWLHKMCWQQTTSKFKQLLDVCTRSVGQWQPVFYNLWMASQDDVMVPINKFMKLLDVCERYVGKIQLACTTFGWLHKMWR